MFRNLFEETLDNKSLNDVFEVLKPTAIHNWDNLLQLSHSIVFEIQNKHKLPNKIDKTVKIVFKGQMKLVGELGLVLFIGRPMLKSIDHMLDVGLYLNDLSQFDSSTNLLVSDMLDELTRKKTQGVNQFIKLLSPVKWKNTFLYPIIHE